MAHPITIPKTVFVAHVQDRHIDPETMVFLTRERAIKSVIKYMREHVAHPEYLAEKDDGQKFEIRYGLESDYGYVIECEIE